MKYQFHQFAPVLEIHRFPHFSFMCFDILSWNFVYDFRLMNVRLKSSVINFRQLLSELYPFWNWKYLKYSFPHSWHTCFDILSWNVVYDFLCMNFRSSDCHYLGSCLKMLCPSWMFSFAYVSCACSDIEQKFLIWLYFLTHHSISKVYYK